MSLNTDTLYSIFLLLLTTKDIHAYVENLERKSHKEKQEFIILPTF